MIAHPRYTLKSSPTARTGGGRVANILLALLCSLWCVRSRSWRRPSRLPLAYATALQHRRQSAGENSYGMLRGHPWLRRAARRRLAAHGSRRQGALQWYRLQAASTSADPPILHRRIRPMGGHGPQACSRASTPTICAEWPCLGREESVWRLCNAASYGSTRIL